MSQLLDGWETDTLLICIKERVEGVRALCNVVLETEGVRDEARTLASNVLHELNGGEAS